MTFEFRATRDFFFATLKNPVGITDTVIVADGFIPLPTDLSAGANGKYMPAIIIDPATNKYEIVWISGHSSGSNQVTVVRGKELTAADAWSAGLQVVVAPTTRDVLMFAPTAASVPADLHIGARIARQDKLDVGEMTKSGLQPSVGVAFASQVGPNMNAVNPPDGAPILVRCGQVNATTDASGNISFNYKAPFPNGTISLSYSSTDTAAIGPHVTFACTASGAGVIVYHNNARKVSAATSFLYTAFGW
ncbi:hypothetical protein [Amycolatopsis sp. NPDC059657]|uniref:hypothetical protein n=1 Tax=Amycolatopsis sp. NPDC059657 TaxID=3346899 RepID=UPI00366DDC5F